MDKKIYLTVDTKDIDRISIGKILYDALDFSNTDNAYEHGISGENSLSISQDSIRKLIKLVNNNNMFRDITKVDVTL